MKPVTVIRGTGPVILGQPHSGTKIPDAIFSRLNETGRLLLDTDWHVPQLYDGLLPEATIVRANFSRYVIDANRAPDGTSLYPGQNTTELVPVSTFDGEPIWHTEPAQAEIAARLESFHRAYHSALQSEIVRVRRINGVAVLYDCHSIRSEIPHLFDDIISVVKHALNDVTSVLVLVPDDDVLLGSDHTLHDNLGLLH